TAVVAELAEKPAEPAPRKEDAPRKSSPAAAKATAKSEAAAPSSSKPAKITPTRVKAEKSPIRANDPKTGGDRFVRAVAVLVIAAGGDYGLMTTVRNKLGPPEAVQPTSIPAVPANKVAPAAPEPTPTAELPVAAP